MKNLLVVLFLLLIVIAGLGFYQGWFHLSTDSTDHKPNVTLSVDEDKIHQDEKTVKEKMQDFGHKAKDKTDDHNDK
jgi:hypothetical protein